MTRQAESRPLAGKLTGWIATLATRRRACLTDQRGPGRLVARSRRPLASAARQAGERPGGGRAGGKVGRVALPAYMCGVPRRGAWSGDPVESVLESTLEPGRRPARGRREDPHRLPRARAEGGR